MLKRFEKQVNLTGNATITNQPMAARTQSKATSSQFFCEMIAKLERTLSTALQNKDQTHSPQTW